jgi:cellulose biosynthesis protein BcsQ
MLATKGFKVLLVDADPQCNLTGMVLGFRGHDELDAFYLDHPTRNIKEALSPAFDAKPEMITAVDCVEIEDRPGLFLLPGHIAFAEYEVTLGIAQELSGSLPTLQNLPGAMSYLLEVTAEKYGAEYILVDMNPSLSSINQNLLMTSEYFLVPTSPDAFSLMALGSLQSVLPKWQAWADKASDLDILKNSVYPFRSPPAKFLGTIIQNYRKRQGEPAAAFRAWVEKIQTLTQTQLFPALDAVGMTLHPDTYELIELLPSYCLATIPDFNSLIAKSQDNQTPVFALSDAQLNETGVVLDQARANRDDFFGQFDRLSEKLVTATSHAAGA